MCSSESTTVTLFLVRFSVSTTSTVCLVHHVFISSFKSLFIIVHYIWSYSSVTSKTANTPGLHETIRLKIRTSNVYVAHCAMDIMWMNHPQHVISRRSNQSITCEADVWSYKKVLFDESTGPSGSHGSVVSNYGEYTAKKPMKSQKSLLQKGKSF